MITQLLFLSAHWFAFGFIAVLLWGKRVKVHHPIALIAWLSIVILAGDFVSGFTVGPIPSMAAASGVTLVAGFLWGIIQPEWNILATTAWTTMVMTTILYLVYTFEVTAFATANVFGYILAVIFYIVEVTGLTLSLSYAYEAFNVLCRSVWKRVVLPDTVPGYAPKVSIHIPAYNEPPEVVAETLKSLAALDYPNYEVLLIDNNTPKESVWKPLAEICQKLGERFRFYHIDHLPGYKSGALNFALSQTAKDAEIIAVVDADYLVDPAFLKETVGLFRNANVAFVQTPQDYRGSSSNSFFEAAYYGYKYFFEISMRSRNEYNAIIFAGTMGLIRKTILSEIGGWDEWCITEDAEASLRILKKGYEACYIHKSYGRGLMPLSFDAFKKQRFRWCFGGIQILKKHWESLTPWAAIADPGNRLTLMQRYGYLFGALQWYNDALNLLFVFFLALGGILSLFPAIKGFRPLTVPFLIMPSVFLLMGLWRFFWVLRQILGLSFKKTFIAMENFFSLGWAVTMASILGLIAKKGVFLRTSKAHSRLRLLASLSAARWETLIGIGCIAVGSLILFKSQSFSKYFLGGMMLWEASLFFSAPVFAAISTTIYSPRDEQQTGTPIRESYAAGWVFAVACILGFLVLTASVAPSRVTPAPYSRLAPPEIPAFAAEGHSSATPSAQTPTGTPAPSVTPETTPHDTPSSSPTPAPGVSPAPSVTPQTMPTGGPGASPSGIIRLPTPSAASQSGQRP